MSLWERVPIRKLVDDQTAHVILAHFYHHQLSRLKFWCDAGRWGLRSICGEVRASLGP